MLNVFRENLRHLKWILWIVAITFVLFFGASWWLVDPSGGQGPWAAMVNGETISARDHQRIARRIDEQYRQAFGDQYEQFRDSLNIEQQAAEQLVQLELIVQDARRMGLSVPKEEVTASIRRAFTDAEGRFIGTEAFDNYVSRQLGYGSVDGFVEAFEKELLFNKWQTAIGASVVIPQAEIEREFRRRYEKVTFDYVALPLSDYEDEVEVENAALGAWYEARRDRYSEGEGRRALYVLLDDAAVSERIEISDEEIQAYYDQNAELFNRPEQRQARQILFRVAPDAELDAVEAARDRAQNVAERIRGGEDFATLAQQLSEDEVSGAKGGDLGYFARGRMVPEFDEAVFTLETGVVSDPVRTDFGFHVIRVEDVRPAGQQPLEEVREQVRGQLRFAEIRDVAGELAAELRAKASEQGGLRGAAEELGLELRDTGVVSRSGTVPGLGPVPEMVRTMFELGQQELSEVLSLPRGEVLLQVEEIVPDYLPPLASRREEVVAEYRREQARDEAVRALQGAMEREGEDLAAVARRLGKEVLSTDPSLVRGQNLPEVGVDRAVENAAFSAVTGALVGPVEGTSAVVALRVSEREEADMSRLDTEGPLIANFLRAPRVDRLVTEKTAALRERAEVRINPQLVASN